MDNDDVILEIKNPKSDSVAVSLAGWQKIRVTRGMERIPADFEVSYTERFPTGNQYVVANPGDMCTLKIGGDTVVTGYVDKVSAGIGPYEHPLTITGRGKCQDLVDCSAQIDTFQFTGQTTAQVAKALSKPFGVEVDAISEGMVHPQINLNIGESAFAVIEKMCKLSQILCYEDEFGRLALAPLSDAQIERGFQEGLNVESVVYDRDMASRFSEYRVYPIGTGIYTDAGQLPMAEFSVVDADVPRFRPKALLAIYGDAGEFVTRARALWECNRRYGRGNVLSLTTDSWRDVNGKLYAPNTLTPLALPSIHVPSASWAIGEVTYRRDESGTHCDLSIMPPEAFMPEPILYYPLPPDAGAALKKG